MSPLPHNLYSAAQVREFDRRAIEQLGIPGIELMSRAGAAAFDLLQRRWPEARRIAVLCGGGNNGGDGYVVARLAHEAGLAVDLVALAAVDGLQGSAREAAEQAIAAGLTPNPFSAGVVEGADLVVDALLGTGLDGEPSGVWREAIDVVNAERKAVLAIDTPSGLDCDSGRVVGAAIRAEATITFIGLKPGLMTAAGPDHCGVLHFDHLGVPGAAFEGAIPTARRIDYDALAHLLGPRRRAAHKGEFGHLLLVGGDHGMSGAVRLAGEAAARSGAGLVSIATRSDHTMAVTAARPELMCHGVESSTALRPLLARATVAAVGPGLGQSAWAEALFATLLESRLPLVVDADALNLLARDPVHRGNWILTPHPGEAARLLGCTVEAVEADRFQAIRELARRYGGAVILKGAGSLAVAEEGTIALCSDGNPGMASGGMGDLLTGIAAGLLAQGLRLADTARLATALHARAADLAAQAGERGLLAADLFPRLRLLLNPVT